MDIVKLKKFRNDQTRMANLMKAFGHPARIAILELLAKRGTCICGDITDELPLAQSTVSQHLKALKSAGIITGEVEGVKTCYCLDQDGLKELSNLFQPFIKNLTTQNDDKIIVAEMEKELKSEVELKRSVKEKYSKIGKSVSAGNSGSCCGNGNDPEEIYSVMSDDYSALDGYNPDADLGLGCGLPTQFAKIKPGDTVVDLGSGAGNDCFVARHEAGSEGRIIGIDFAESMIEKATSNAEKLGYENVEFLQGDIEDIPLRDNVVSVVISNCVLNLVPDKQKVFSEIFRILKPGGHFSISDIVLSGELPAEFQKDAEMYAGCVSGAIQKEVYLNLIQGKGFENLTIQKEKPIILPRKLLSRYLNEEEISQFYDGSTGIYSITVYAEKPV